MHKDYSSTPLPKKLGIEEESRVALQKAPPGFAEELGVKPRLRGEFDVAVLFATRQGELRRAFTPLARRLAPAGGLWVAWPKKASGVSTDLTFDSVQKTGLDVFAYFQHEDEPTAPRYAERLLELVSGPAGG